MIPFLNDRLKHCYAFLVRLNYRGDELLSTNLNYSYYVASIGNLKFELNTAKVELHANL